VHPHILCKHKLLFWMRLIAINRLTALIIIYLLALNNPVFLIILFCLFWSRVIFSAQKSEFSYLSRGGEPAVFVKDKEAQSSRKNQR